MDLIPKPDQVVSAAANVAHQLLDGPAHLGMLTVRAARATSCSIIDGWIAAPSGKADEPATKTGKRAADRAARSASKDAIGANTTRRYGSASSRTFAPK